MLENIDKPEAKKIIWNKKAAYCFLSGLLTSLWLYSQAYPSPGYSVILQFVLVGIVPGLFFPAALLITEDKIEYRNAVNFLLLAELIYVLCAISIWITVIHDYFIPVALGFLGGFIPVYMFIIYYYFVKKVHRFKNSLNWIIASGLGSILLLIIMGYVKVHFFHPYMNHPDRMEYYFHVLIWFCPLWQTCFAIIISRGRKRIVHPSMKKPPFLR